MQYVVVKASQPSVRKLLGNMYRVEPSEPFRPLSRALEVGDGAMASWLLQRVESRMDDDKFQQDTETPWGPMDP